MPSADNNSGILYQDKNTSKNTNTNTNTKENFDSNIQENLKLNSFDISEDNSYFDSQFENSILKHGLIYDSGNHDLQIAVIDDSTAG